MVDRLGSGLGLAAGRGSADQHRAQPRPVGSGPPRVIHTGEHHEITGVERVGTVLGRQPLEYRRTLVRGDRYDLVTSWTPEGVRLGAEHRGRAQG